MDASLSEIWHVKKWHFRWGVILGGNPSKAGRSKSVHLYPLLHEPNLYLPPLGEGGFIPRVVTKATLDSLLSLLLVGPIQTRKTKIQQETPLQQRLLSGWGVAVKTSSFSILNLLLSSQLALAFFLDRSLCAKSFVVTLQ